MENQINFENVISFLCDCYGYSEGDFLLYDDTMTDELINDYFEEGDAEKLNTYLSLVY